MKGEIIEVPLTKESVQAIEHIAGNKPKPPVVVPISYEKVTMPGVLGECILGVLRSPGAFMLDDRNAPVGPSHLTPDEHGQITDGIYTGITLQTLLEGIPKDTLTLWALHLNLADPSMPKKLLEYRRAKQDIGLVAIVIPHLANTYLRALSEFDPVLYIPNASSNP